MTRFLQKMLKFQFWLWWHTPSSGNFRLFNCIFPNLLSHWWWMSSSSLHLKCRWCKLVGWWLRFGSSSNRPGKVSWLLSLDDWTLAAVQLSPASIIIQWRELITSPSIAIAFGICLHLTTIHQVVGCQPHPLHHAHSHGIQLSCQNVRVWPGLRARSNPQNNCLTW